MTVSTYFDPEIGREMESARLRVTTFELSPCCCDCGTQITPEMVGLMTPDVAHFYCFECVTKVYEAMKAAQEGGTVRS